MASNLDNVMTRDEAIEIFDNHILPTTVPKLRWGRWTASNTFVCTWNGDNCEIQKMWYRGERHVDVA